MTKDLTEWRLTKPRKNEIDVNISFSFEVETTSCSVTRLQIIKLRFPSLY